ESIENISRTPLRRGACAITLEREFEVGSRRSGRRCGAMSGSNDDDTTTGPAAPGSGAGSESAISRAAHAAFESWQAANKIAGQRLVAAHELMAECVAHPDCQPDPRHPGRSVVDPEVMAASRLA